MGLADGDTINPGILIIVFFGLLTGFILFSIAAVVAIFFIGVFSDADSSGTYAEVYPLLAENAVAGITIFGFVSIIAVVLIVVYVLPLDGFQMGNQRRGRRR